MNGLAAVLGAFGLIQLLASVFPSRSNALYRFPITRD